MHSSRHPARLERRDFLKASLASCGLVTLGSGTAWAQGLPATPANATPADGLRAILSVAAIGQLLPADANGIRLPEGFRSRVIARSGQPVAASGYVWHNAPDGGSCVPTGDGGWIYVSNAELSNRAGGVSAVVFDAGGAVVNAYRICGNTSRNCAGGLTPWGTWLTCEEVDRGRVLECDPRGVNGPVVRQVLGAFQHEAAACDPATGFVYLTEDEPDGRLYRFRPTQAGNLSAGVLEVARLSGAGPLSVQWLTVPNPNPSSRQTRTRYQVRSSTAFNGGEGCWYHNGAVYITTKGDNRVWALDLGAGLMDIVYDDSTSSTPVLTGVDNVTVSSTGSIYVAEDGGDMQVCVIDSTRAVAPILQVTGQASSEITGVAFSPDGTRLYFSSQRGTTGSSSGGITYEVTGPFSNV